MKIFIIIYILVFIGCTPDKNPVINQKYRISHFSKSDLENAILLKGKKIYLTEFLKPSHLILSTNYLIIVENGLNDIFYIYDKDEFLFYRSIGKNGLGPGEITFCYNIIPIIETDEFWAYDVNTKQLLLFDSRSDIPLAKQTIKQTNKLAIAIDMIPGRDGNFIARCLHNDHVFVEYNRKGDSLGSYGSWENLYDNKKQLPTHVLVNILQGRLSASPNTNFFSLSGALKDYIEILNLSDSSIVSIRGPLNVDPDFEIDSSQGFEAPVFKKGWKIMYRMSYMTNDSIFSLFIGKSQEELKNNTDSSYVLQFNYEGKLINVFNLDFNIISIAIEDNKIFALSRDREPNLVIFEMGS